MVNKEKEVLCLNLGSNSHDEEAKDLFDLLLELQGEDSYQTQCTPCDQTALCIQGQKIVYSVSEIRKFLQGEVDKVYQIIRREFPHEYVHGFYQVFAPYPFPCPCCEKEPNYKQIISLATQTMGKLEQSAEKITWRNSATGGLFQNFLFPNAIAKAGIAMDDKGLSFSVDYIGEKTTPSLRETIIKNSETNRIDKTKIKERTHEHVFSKNPLPFREVFPELSQIYEHIGKTKPIIRDR